MKYISHAPYQIDEMLKELEISDVTTLFSDVSGKVKLDRDLDLPLPLNEIELKKEFAVLSGKNKAADYINFIGAGAYDHYVPAAVKALLSRSEFYTAYTPYQAERSQGTLAAIFEYQTMIAELTGMDAANASLYDGASSLAEAILMACRIKKKNKVVISQTLHPEYIETSQTYALGSDIKVLVSPYNCLYETDWDKLETLIDSETAALVVSVPNFFGVIEDVRRAQKIAQEKGVMLIVAANPIALAFLKPPSEYGADIVVGEGQPLGNSLNFGGPYLGFMSTKAKYLRSMPGRIVGETIDKEGNRAFVLTLQAREQHIRREKATSNICSNEALNALAATIYLAYLGKEGLKSVAYNCIANTQYFINEAKKYQGIRVINSKVFNEVAVEVDNLEEKYQKALNAKILPGLKLDKFFPEQAGKLLVAFTEKRTKHEIDELVKILGVD